MTEEMFGINLRVGPIKPIELFGDIKPADVGLTTLIKLEVAQLNAKTAEALHLTETLLDVVDFSELVRGILQINKNQARLITFNVDKDRFYNNSKYRRKIAITFVSAMHEAFKP